MQQRHGRFRRALAGSTALLALALASGLLAAPASAAPEPDLDALVAADPTAVRVDERTVSFDGGDVVLVLPDEASTSARAAARAASASACPTGWYCLFEHPGWSGRMLQFRDCGTTQALSSYGFTATTSSWANKRTRSAYVYDGGTTIWASYAGTSAFQVAADDNDRADAVRLGC